VQYGSLTIINFETNVYTFPSLLDNYSEKETCIYKIKKKFLFLFGVLYEVAAPAFKFSISFFILFTVLLETPVGAQHVRAPS
jgi:hypothetical protein